MMKRRNYFLYIVCLSVTLWCATACQRNELPTAEDTATIGFHSAVDNEGWLDRQTDLGGYAGADRASRGMLMTDMYDSFGCWAGFYNSNGQWNERSPMNLMYRREIKKSEAYNTHAYWPGANKKVRFFAYAPYGLSTLSVPAKVTGNPLLTYTVPADVTLQKDLLIASSGEYAGDFNRPVPLSFKHALTAVRFLERELPEGVVTSITVGGVFSKANLRIGAQPAEVWSALDVKRDFTVRLDYRTAGVPVADRVMNLAGAYLLMIPQPMQDSAVLTLRIRDNTGVETEYSTSLKGTADWEMGKVASYSLRISNDILVVVQSLNDWKNGGSL